MTVSTSKAAYEDCYDLFDQALKAEKGIRVNRPTKGQATQLYTRLHYARKLLRAESREMNKPGDPAFDTSPYDSFIVRKAYTDDEWWIYIEPRDARNDWVESL